MSHDCCEATEGSSDSSGGGSVCSPAYSSSLGPPSPVIKKVSRVRELDQEATRKAFVHMLIVNELSFKLVEDEGFKSFIGDVCPEFVVPSATEVISDSMKMYVEEKSKMKLFFKSLGRRVSLSVGTWTSNRGLDYVCLTAHFIDEDWKSQKRILNFIPCSSEKGDELGRVIEKCLSKWGIGKIFSITFDDTSCDDTCMAYLMRRFSGTDVLVLGGKFMHARCVPSIISQVVRDELEDANVSVERVRTMVRYVVQSPTHLKNFHDFVIEERIDSNRSLCLDVPTRWDSVYFMLEAALIYEKAFKRCEACDADFRGDFMRMSAIGLPTKDDWITVEKLVKVLSFFYGFTVELLGTQHVTPNIFADSVCDIHTLLNKWMGGDDRVLADMAFRMKRSFDKYCGDLEKINLLMYVAVMLDPRYKCNYVPFILKKMYDERTKLNLARLAKEALMDLFGEYKRVYDSKGAALSVSEVDSTTKENVSHGNELDLLEVQRMQEFLMTLEGANDETELESYLAERLYKVRDPKQFDVLEWWKLRSSVYPVLSILARDVFAMPLSTMTLESAFSSEGRVLSDFRSSLAPKTVQALICYQDWTLREPMESVVGDYASLENVSGITGSGMDFISG